MPFLFVITIDLLSLGIFGYSLSHNAGDGLVSPILQPFWLMVLLCMHVVFFWGVYARLLSISPIQAIRERLRKHRIVYAVLVCAAWAIALLQTIFHITIIFLNSVFTEQNASLLSIILTVALVTACALAVTLLASVTEDGDRFTPLRSHPLLYGFASMLFPLPTLVLFFTHAHDGAHVQQQPNATALEAILVVAFNYIVLNILHIETAVVASSNQHGFAPYATRAGMIMLFLYIPYYAALQLSTKKRLHIVQIVWPIVYFVLELAIIYTVVL